LCANRVIRLCGEGRSHELVQTLCTCRLRRCSRRYADFNADGIVERYPLFSDSTMQYYWDYDNQGLKLAQLRFYATPTNVN
jgi:hypothetical protein